MNHEQIDRIRFAVCAIGYLRRPQEEVMSEPLRDHFEVVGTGFLIGQRRVMTCAHVLSDLAAETRKKGLPEEQRRVAQFGYMRADGTWRTEFRIFESVQVDEQRDIAVLQLALAPDSKPVPVAGPDYQPRLGDEVAICGYGHGSVLLRKGDLVSRVGPILQRGCIAALAPFDRPIPHELLLDLVAAPAGSGSPVFLASTGAVMGILLKAQEGRTVIVSVAAPLYEKNAGTGIVYSARVELRTAD